MDSPNFKSVLCLVFFSKYALMGLSITLVDFGAKQTMFTKGDSMALQPRFIAFFGLSLLFLSSSGGEAMAKPLLATEKCAFHAWAFYVCCAVTIIVFLAFIDAMVRFSRSGFPDSHAHIKYEIAWTIVPFILLGLMAVPIIPLLLKCH